MVTEETRLDRYAVCDFLLSVWLKYLKNDWVATEQFNMQFLKFLFFCILHCKQTITIIWKDTVIL